MKLACIISVLNEYKNCENIKKNILDNNQFVNFYIIDGGSMDGTYDYLERISKSYSFKLFRNENDCGIYDSWNKCLEFVSEDYVCFCGADDLLNSQFSQKVSNLVNNIFTNESHLDIIYGNAIFDLSGIYKKLQPPANPVLLNIDKNKNRVTFDLFHSGLYMNLNLLRNKFDDTMRLAGDLELFVRLNSFGKKIKSHYIPIEQAIISYNGISTKVSKYRLYVKEYQVIEKKYNVFVLKNKFKIILSYIIGVDLLFYFFRKIKWAYL